MDTLQDLIEEDKEVEPFRVNYEDDEADDELICLEDLKQPEQMKKQDIDQKNEA